MNEALLDIQIMHTSIFVMLDPFVNARLAFSHDSLTLSSSGSLRKIRGFTSLRETLYSNIVFICVLFYPHPFHVEVAAAAVEDGHEVLVVVLEEVVRAEAALVLVSHVEFAPVPVPVPQVGADHFLYEEGDEVGLGGVQVVALKPLRRSQGTLYPIHSSSEV